jgi:hypothetical protein
MTLLATKNPLCTPLINERSATFNPQRAVDIERFIIIIEAILGKGKVYYVTLGG